MHISPRLRMRGAIPTLEHIFTTLWALQWFRALVPEVCSVDPSGSAKTSQGICIHFCNGYSDFYLVFNERDNVLLEIIPKCL